MKNYQPVQSGQGNSCDTTGRESHANHVPVDWQMYIWAGTLVKSLGRLHCGVHTVPPNRCECAQAMRPFSGGA